MSRGMHYVLVPGAWLGGWAFNEVGARLESAGHEVTSLTLSGLAERAHIPVETIGLQTHVDDILTLLADSDEPSRVILVGHSYSGIPVSEAASHFNGELAQVVYLDANIASHGKAFVDFGAPNWRDLIVAEIEENDGYWPVIPADDLEGQELDDDQVAYLVENASPQPGRTLTEPASIRRPLSDIPSTYVKCLLDWPDLSPDVEEMLKSPRWTLVQMETGHWPMISRPTELADLLLTLA